STALPQMNAFIAHHGNEALWTGVNDTERGEIAVEFYNNTCKIGSSYRVIWIRGGRFLIANNSFSSIGSIGSIVVPSEEECWASRASAGWWPLRPITAWPAEDMANGFVFGNTVNGQPQDDSIVAQWDPGDAVIQKGRDWFDKPPDMTTNTVYPNC